MSTRVCVTIVMNDPLCVRIPVVARCYAQHFQQSCNMTLDAYVHAMTSQIYDDFLVFDIECRNTGKADMIL